MAHPVTFPLSPKTMVLLASLGRSVLACTFVTGVFVQHWAAGRLGEKRKQPGFPIGYSGRLRPKSEDPGLERCTGEVLCSG